MIVEPIARASIRVMPDRLPTVDRATHRMTQCKLRLAEVLNQRQAEEMDGLRRVIDGQAAQIERLIQERAGLLARQALEADHAEHRERYIAVLQARVARARAARNPLRRLARGLWRHVSWLSWYSWSVLAAVVLLGLAVVLSLPGW